jgi:hypothetical protein
MKKVFTTLLLSIIVASAFAKPTDWMYLVTADQFGVITKTTTYQDLINLFGKEKVKDETRTGAEGEGTYKVTVVYKGSPLEMTIGWVENKWHKTIASVECSQLKSPYYTKDSLKIGSNLNKLVKVNKAPITFYGFGWDYSGLISDYHKGALAKSKVRFSLNWNGKNDTTLLGDGEFISNTPQVTKRATQIYISSIQVNFVE